MSPNSASILGLATLALATGACHRASPAASQCDGAAPDSMYSEARTPEVGCYDNGWCPNEQLCLLGKCWARCSKESPYCNSNEVCYRVDYGCGCLHHVNESEFFCASDREIAFLDYGDAVLYRHTGGNWARVLRSEIQYETGARSIAPDTCG